MLYLGQALSYQDRQDTNNEKVPAIFRGKTPKKDLVILTLLDGIKEIELWDKDKLDIIRTSNSESPTGWAIWHGPLSKGLYIDFKMKRPENEVLMETFKSIQKLINKYEKAKN